MRVVLDTNILISAFIFPGGPPEAAYRAALDGRVELVTSPPLLAELGRVLVDKFGWEPPLGAEAVAQVARVAIVVRPETRVDVVLEDPDDDRVLEAAAPERPTSSSPATDICSACDRGKGSRSRRRRRS